MKLICCSIFVIAFIQGLFAAPNRKVEEPTKDDTHKIPVKADVKSVAENEPVKAISEQDSKESSCDSRDFDKTWTDYKAADAHLETSDQGKNSAVKIDVSGNVSGTNKINKDDSYVSELAKAYVSVDVNESAKSSVVDKSAKSKLKKDISSGNKSISKIHGSSSAESPKLTAPKPVKSAKSTETRGKDGKFKFPLNSKSESFEKNIHVDRQNGTNLEYLIKQKISGQIPNEAVDFQWEAHNDGSDSGSLDIDWEWDYSKESSEVGSVKVTTKTDTNAAPTETNTAAASNVIVVDGTDSSIKASTHHDISHHRLHHEDESHENKPLRQLGPNGKANHTQPWISHGHHEHGSGHISHSKPNTHSKPQPATPTKETASHSQEHIHDNGYERDHFAHNGYNHGHGSHGQSASDEDGTALKPQTNSESNATSDAPINTQNPDTSSGVLVDSDTPMSGAALDTQNPDTGSDAPVDSDTLTSDASVDSRNPNTTSDASADTQNPDEYSCRLPQVPILPKKHFGSRPEIICSCSCRPFDDIYSDVAIVVSKAINLSLGFVNSGDPKLDCSCNCVTSRDCQ